ncbi:MAG: 3-dehydroquinate synthase [Pseudomonadota bacterium]
MNGNIYITGFMGVGKSTVGKALSKLLKRPLIDMDRTISTKTGLSIKSYFEQFGEASFRNAETELLKEIASDQRLVIATGGGVPVSPQNRSIMRSSGKIIHLNMPIEQCFQRLGNGSNLSRPKWKDRDSVEALYNRRAPMYEDCDYTIDVSGKLPGDCAWEICERLHANESIDIKLGSSSHGLSISWRTPEELPELIRSRKCFVVTDRTVAKLQLGRYLPFMDGATIVRLPVGERSKSLNTARRLYESMLKEKLGREDVLIAIGGGVVTDICAFVASTYKRGIPFILVSTTMVGCVDAAIGGKAAVDLNQVKNSVGCFSTPSSVLLDLRALSTLPLSCISDGLVEAYKTGLTLNPDLAKIIETDLDNLLKGDAILLAEVVKLSASAKAKVVSQDFTEKGFRRILNFGHTYGHAIESLNDFKISHGMAVAVGMMAAVSISENRGLLDKKDSSRIQRTLSKFIHGNFKLPNTNDAWDVMLNDKKNRGGRIGFVLLENLGSAVFVEDIQFDEVSRAINSARGLLNG